MRAFSIILSATAILLSLSSNATAYEIVRSFEGAGNTTYVLRCNNGSTAKIYAMHSNPNNPYGGYRSRDEEARRACGE